MPSYFPLPLTPKTFKALVERYDKAYEEIISLKKEISEKENLIALANAESLKADIFLLEIQQLKEKLRLSLISGVNDDFNWHDRGEMT